MEEALWFLPRPEYGALQRLCDRNRRADSRRTAMKYRAIKHAFVQFIPDTLDGGTVYVSIPFATAVHNCFCGCGREVVTPLSPTQWQLIFNGKTISLHPSVGSWSLPCMSHYW